LLSLGDEVDGYSCDIDDEADRRGRGDEGMARHVEAEHGRRADTALIANQAAQGTGYTACKPGCPTPEAQAVGKAGEAHDGGNDQ